MMTNRRTLLAGLGGAAVGSLLIPALVNNERATIKPEQGGWRANYFPNSIFETHDGRKVKFYDDLIRGKLVMINMMLEICTDGICPSMTANLVRVQEALGDRVGKDIHMYSITLLPEHDTPKTLAAYAQAFGVKPGWTFLAGSAVDTDIIRRKLGFYDLDESKDSDKKQHTGMVRMGNDAYDRWCMMPALSTPKMIKDAVLSLSV